MEIYLEKIHQNFEGDTRDDLFSLITIACGVELVSKFKTELSTLSDCRWMIYRNDEKEYNNPLFVSDLILILNSLCSEHDKIDLAYLTILEICHGTNNQFVFLNAVMGNHNLVGEFDLLRKFFINDEGVSKPQSPHFF